MQVPDADFVLVNEPKDPTMRISAFAYPLNPGKEITSKEEETMHQNRYSCPASIDFLFGKEKGEVLNRPSPSS